MRSVACLALAFLMAGCASDGTAPGRDMLPSLPLPIARELAGPALAEGVVVSLPAGPWTAAILLPTPDEVWERPVHPVSGVPTGWALSAFAAVHGLEEGDEAPDVPRVGVLHFRADDGRLTSPWVSGPGAPVGDGEVRRIADYGECAISSRLALVVLVVDASVPVDVVLWSGDIDTEPVRPTPVRPDAAAAGGLVATYEELTGPEAPRGWQVDDQRTSATPALIFGAQTGRFQATLEATVPASGLYGYWLTRNMIGADVGQWTLTTTVDDGAPTTRQVPIAGAYSSLAWISGAGPVGSHVALEVGLEATNTSPGLLILNGYVVPLDLAALGLALDPFTTQGVWTDVYPDVLVDPLLCP